MSDGAVSHGDHNGLQVGVQGAIGIQPSLAAGLAVPVLDVTVLVAGSLDSLHVGDGAVSHGNDHVLQVGLLSQSLVSPSDTAVLAVPVSDVAVLVAGGVNSLHSGDVVVGSLVGQLAAQSADLVALVGVLVLARGLRIGAVDHDGSVLLTESDVFHIGVEEVLGVVLHDQVVGAGNGIVLDLEGGGEVQLTGNVLGSGTVNEVHQAVAAAQLRISDVLFAPAGAALDHVLLDVLVQVLVIDPLSAELKNVSVVHNFNHGGNDAGVVQQINFHFDLIAGVGFLHGDERNGGLVSGGNGSERNHRTQQKHRQQNS